MEEEAVKVTSPHKRRERILAFGSYGAGKTYAWFQWARALKGNVYVIDTDQTVIPYLESEEFAEVGDRIEYEEPVEWPEYIEAAKKFRKAMGPDDLFVLDMASEPWTAVQQYFSDQVYGKDLGDYWLDHMRDLAKDGGKGSKNPFDGVTDWQAIKKMYRHFMALVVRMPGHVYLATGEKAVVSHLDGAEVQRQYAKSNGFKPEGEKTLGHTAHTVLRFNNQRITTVKDRQREDLKGVQFTDFSRDYLIKVAGWRPTA